MRSSPATDVVIATGLENTSEDGIFVRNLAFNVDAEQLKFAFEKFGNVVGAQVAKDGRGMSKG
jgi:RNA recognition motif-containing protein